VYGAKGNSCICWVVNNLRFAVKLNFCHMRDIQVSTGFSDTCTAECPAGTYDNAIEGAQLCEVCPAIENAKEVTCTRDEAETGTSTLVKCNVNFYPEGSMCKACEPIDNAFKYVCNTDGVFLAMCNAGYYWPGSGHSGVSSNFAGISLRF
jgi:hypothetical protein